MSDDTPVTPVVETPETPPEKTPDPTPPEPKEPEKQPEPVEVKTRGVAPDTSDENDPLEVDPQDEKTINRIVESKLSPIAVKVEVNEYIEANPQFAKHKDNLIKYASHPSYKDVPLDFIAAGLAKDDLMKIGAQKEREAQAVADSTKDPGTTVRTQGGTKNWLTVPKEDFEAEKARVYGRR